MREDAATAEISRAQVWQWIRDGALLDNGQRVTASLFNSILPEELARIRTEVGDARYASGRFDEAAALFARLSLAERFEEFLTLPAYDRLLEHEQRDLRA